MHILEKYIEGLSMYDGNKIADLFTEDAVFNDSAMTPFGRDVIHFDGRESIRAGFIGMLSGKRSKPKMLSINGDVMDYDIVMVSGDMVIPCRGTAKMKGELIKEYTVIPRP